MPGETINQGENNSNMTQWEKMMEDVKPWKEREEDIERARMMAEAEDPYYERAIAERNKLKDFINQSPDVVVANTPSSKSYDGGVAGGIDKKIMETRDKVAQTLYRGHQAASQAGMVYDKRKKVDELNDLLNK